MIDILSFAAAPFLITFREALEAALIVGIIAAYVRKIGREDLNKYIIVGSSSAIGISLLLGIIIFITFGELTGIYEKVFEGSAAITATIVLTYMIFWMGRNSRMIKGELEGQVDSSITGGHMIGIASLTFVAVVREGIETVLFLSALISVNTLATIIGASLGIGTVIILALIMMNGIRRLDIQRFFKYTSILLIIFAAGLLGFGTHELIEAGDELGMSLGLLGEPAFNINPDDVTHPLHEKGAVGSIMSALVGYDGNPEWLRVITYLGYWFVVGSYMIKTHFRQPNR